MESRCQICLQPATKKCTSCGRVFCDLHIRYGGQAGGMYGGDVGYYCDECWETRIRSRTRRVGIIVGVVLALLAANVAGLFVFRSEAADVPWISVSVAVAALMLILVLVVLKRRR